MICRYRLTIGATCPVDQLADRYEVEITSPTEIRVERILEAVDLVTKTPKTQEVITVELARRLRAEVRTVGHHSGVLTEVTA